MRAESIKCFFETTMKPNIKVIIPAYNEEESIGKVLKDIPMQVVDEVVVVNNASSDCTACEAELGGATVLHEPERGYGRACLKGINYIGETHKQPDIVVFLDGDYSDHPEELPKIVDPILNQNKDLVIGSRALGSREKGAMTPQQVFGNWLATSLLKLFYNVSFTDLGPFRAVKYESLMKLGMVDKTYGWTVEMQLKAAKANMNCAEVPVTYRKRIGVSKVSGTVKGTIMAGYKIIWTIFRYL